MVSALLLRRLLAIQVVLTLAAAYLFGAEGWQEWALAGLLVLFGVAVTYWAVFQIIGPLETLTQAAQRMAGGEAPSELAIRSRNEIGTLAAAFNSMNRQLTARFRDLEEQRTRVEQSHARLETVLGAMLEGVMAVDAKEGILFANHAALSFLDLNPAMMVGRPIWEVVRQAELVELVRRALAGEQPPRMEIEVARTQVTVAATASPLPGQPVPGAVLVLHDVTELRRLERLRREFVQNVSHELKTPLSSIAAYADTLLEGALDDPQCRRQFVERISEQTERLHTLILDLLALGRLEAEEAVFELKAVDVTRIVAASVDAHLAVAQTKRLKLLKEGHSEPVYGIAEDEGLRIIIDNLLDNAINYTLEGGRIIVRWWSEREAVVIEVQDTGVGIAKEHQTRIFERFYRIDKARSRELGGTGLGLAIVKHLCQAFGGSVQVRSQLGQGSTFTVKLRGTSADAELLPPPSRLSTAPLLPAG
jgi:two-component system phosphate regulon sensor histidine kinase PhoR